MALVNKITGYSGIDGMKCWCMHDYQGYPLCIQYQKEIVFVWQGRGVCVQLYMGEEGKVHL